MQRYLFTNCELDLLRHELVVAGEVIPLEPVVFDLLTTLVENQGHLLTRDMLIDKVWRGKLISDSAIDVAINAARKAVGDNGKAQRIIKTIPRKEFKLLPSVISAHSSTDRNATGNSEVPARSPTLAVMEFQLTQNSQDYQYLARGIADDIATELSRFRDLSVLSTQSTFQHDSEEKTGNDFGATLGATHVVSGHIQLRGADIAINVSLTDIDSKKSLWAEKYRFKLNDAFEIQDRIVSSIVSCALGRLDEHQVAQMRTSPTTDLSAYDCELQGLVVFKSCEVSQEDNRYALEWFDRALEIDPDYARARAWRYCAASNFWSNPPTSEEVDENFQSMKHALEVDPNDHEVQHIMGALQLIKGNISLCDFHLSKSVDLNPNDPLILLRTGYYRSFMGEYEAALDLANTAFQRNPLHPNWYWIDIGVIYFGSGQYRKALSCLSRGYQDIEQNYVYRLACLSELSRKSEAAAMAEEIACSYTHITQAWVRSAYPYRCYNNSNTLDMLTDALGYAGLPMN